MDQIGPVASEPVPDHILSVFDPVEEMRFDLYCSPDLVEPPVLLASSAEVLVDGKTVLVAHSTHFDCSRFPE